MERGRPRPRFSMFTKGAGAKGAGETPALHYARVPAEGRLLHPVGREAVPSSLRGAAVGVPFFRGGSLVHDVILM
jgi:hypothetical protein